jgi:6-phosphogluconolactonase (cycloisomerase 2 family)
MARSTLRVVDGPGQGMEITVEPGFVVGRGETGAGDLRGDKQISRRHAQFTYTEGGALLVDDLGSTNGTLVNDRKIGATRVLHVGDRIQLGATTLEVTGVEVGHEPTRVSNSPPVPAPPPAAAPPVAADPAGAAATPVAPAPVGNVHEPVSSRRGSRAGLGAVVAVLLIAGVGAAAYVIGHNGRKTTTVASASSSGALPPDVQGVVYVESNIAQPDGNSVLALQYRENGDLHPMRIAEYPTGGAGSADLTDSGVLDADQHLLLNRDKRLLFAVNQGSDSIAVFHIQGDGSLVPVHGSPFPSGGMAPASVGVSGSVAVVANKAQDGVRDLTKIAPTYATFHIAPDGSLSQFGPVIKALPGASPTDAMVAPDGKFVMSTEEGGPLRAFVLGPNGLTQGSNSPLEPDSSIFPANLDPTKRWGLGLSAYPTRNIVYIGMATVNKIAVYTYDDTGRLTFVRAVDAPGAMLPCWTLVNKTGTRLYTANAGNNTMSVFDLTDPMNPKPLQNLKLHADGNPWDMRFDPTERMIFLVDPRARMNVPPGNGQGVHTLMINPDGTLTEPAYSPVTLPVGLNINPYGMAVYGRP